MSIRDSLTEHYNRAFTQPAHKGVLRGFYAAGFGGWVGGIISGTGGLPRLLAGLLVTGIAMVVALWLIPHPTVIVEAWFAREGVDTEEIERE